MGVSAEYETYLQSRVWRQKSTLKIVLDGGLNALEMLYWHDTGRFMPSTRIRCEQCEYRYKRRLINVHHLHYRNIFHEKREDLAVLCEGCHSICHGKAAPMWWHLVQAGQLDPEQLANNVVPIAVAVEEAFAVYELTGPDRRMSG